MTPICVRLSVEYTYNVHEPFKVVDLKDGHSYDVFQVVVNSNHGNWQAIPKGRRLDKNGWICYVVPTFAEQDVVLYKYLRDAHERFEREFARPY